MAERQRTRVRYLHWADAQLSKCHENVDACVHGHPDCKAIRSARVQPIGGIDGGYLIAHSLIELPDGERVDITPLTQQEKDSGDEEPKRRANLAFLEHRGTDAQFEQFRKTRRIAWPPTVVPDIIECDSGSSEGLM